VTPDCPFCDYAGPSPVLEFMHGSRIFEPLNPVTPGHVLVVPTLHVKSFVSAKRWDKNEREAVSNAFEAAVWWAAEGADGSHFVGSDRAANIISSAGEAATQTVEHLHVHVVPRRTGDGLMLPWS